MLEKGLIEQPHMWHLVMEVTPTVLRVAVYSLFDDHGMVTDTIRLSGEAPLLQQFEEAVYENPLLLCDFAGTTIIWDTPRFQLLPGFVADDETARLAFRAAMPEQPEEAPTTLIFNELPEIACRLAFEIPDDLLGFLRRTFNNSPISHPAGILTRYFSNKYPTRSYGKSIANLREGRLDLLTLGDTAPLMLTSYEIKEPMDAAYYILAARKLLNLKESDEIMIAGDREMRSAVAPVLRRYVQFVLPAIFPPTMFRAGRDSMTIPFEMAVAPILSQTN